MYSSYGVWDQHLNIIIVNTEYYYGGGVGGECEFLILGMGCYNPLLHPLMCTPRVWIMNYFPINNVAVLLNNYMTITFFQICWQLLQIRSDTIIYITYVNSIVHKQQALCHLTFVLKCVIPQTRISILQEYCIGASLLITITIRFGKELCLMFTH